VNQRFRVAAVSDVPPGRGIEVVAGGRMVALFNIDGEFHALDGVCPHSGGPLGQGALTGCVVTCPWHGWQFDVTTGEHQLNANLSHPAFPVTVEGEDVFVDLPE
jgi:nitrite reductase (NADH) small subunit